MGAGVNALHVYGQPGPHDPVLVLGDLATLRALRDALDSLVTDGSTATVYTHSADGEGYYVRIAALPVSRMSGLMVPYSSEPYAARDGSGEMPHAVVCELQEAADEVDPGATLTLWDFADGNGPVPAHRHLNGGGWVADTARVDETVLVGPDAKVYGCAAVKDSVELRGHAQVYGAACVTGACKVADHAQVFGHAVVSGAVTVAGLARVYGDAMVSDHAAVRGCALVAGRATVGGASVVEGCDTLGDDP